MGVLRSKHGVYYVRKKVPPKLEAAVSTVLGASRPRVSWLKKSLHTKDPRDANVLAKPALMEFDRVLAKAARALEERPLRSGLSDHEIARLADYHFASLLSEDEDIRREGTGSEELFQRVTRELAEAGVPFETPFATTGKPRFGLSDRELYKCQEDIEWTLPPAREALARGDISFVHDEVEELLAIFRINLDRNCASYRRLGFAVLRRHVEGLEAIERRNRGNVVQTPPLVETTQDVASGDTLSAAMEGWKKAKQPGPNVISEYAHAVRRFTELHSDLRIIDIRRSHVRTFREALQAIPVRRTGALKTAALPELMEWSNKHPDVPKIAPATVNKLLGGVQAIAVWGYDNGLTPDDVPWSDPFARMRLVEDEPGREPWTIAELQLLFNSPVFASNARPKGGSGEAAYWLPLLGLFTGARQGELAPLTVSDVTSDEATGIVFITVTEDHERGTRLKTASSRRVVPVHPELVRLGFLSIVEDSRNRDGENAPLFALLKQGPRGGYAETWSKWFGRYIRSIGITNKDRVFHSFRHGFKDALRTVGESEDINDALTGHSGGGVGRSYGAKEIVRRFGLPRLAEAVAKVRYPGLDLSRLYIGSTGQAFQTEAVAMRRCPRASGA
jgi:integrase